MFSMDMGAETPLLTFGQFKQVAETVMSSLALPSLMTYGSMVSN